MSGKIPNAFIDDLLARVDVVELIDARVPLKKTGVNYSACCPFHNEKTPSFTVSREKQFYHCFGCGAHGTAIRFLMEYDRMGFVEAVEDLAGRLGLSVPREGGEAGAGEVRESLQPLYDLQASVAQFYAAQLRQEAGQCAVTYLKGRGVSGEVAARYALGYAPAAWRTLGARFDVTGLRQLGLVLEKDGREGCYDRFRDRLMFPIRDRRGRVVGFGGRVLDSGDPKYLNSPETALFRKRQEVYGLYELARSGVKPTDILVVEGYMDVVALAQHGVPNAVATLGTAMSADHLNLLFRQVNDLVFSFDGDAAGRAAAWRALETALPVLRDGRSVRFLALPEGEDPDSLVRSEGAEAFRARVRAAQPLSDYFFARLAERADASTLEGRARLGREGQTLLSQVPEGHFRTLMRQRLAEWTQLVLAEDPALRRKTPSVARAVSLQPSLWPRLTALVLERPARAGLIETALVEWLESARSGEAGLFRALLGVARQEPHLTPGALVERFREPADAYATLIARLGELEGASGVNREAEFAELLVRLDAKRRRSEARHRQQALPSGSAVTDEDKEILRRLGRGKEH